MNRFGAILLWKTQFPWDENRNPQPNPYYGIRFLKSKAVWFFPRLQSWCLYASRYRLPSSQCMQTQSIKSWHSLLNDAIRNDALRRRCVPGPHLGIKMGYRMGVPSLPGYTIRYDRKRKSKLSGCGRFSQISLLDLSCWWCIYIVNCVARHLCYHICYII